MPRARKNSCRIRQETDKIVGDCQQQIKSLSEELGRAQASIEAAESKSAEVEAQSVRARNESESRIFELNGKIQELANDLAAAIEFAEQVAAERIEVEEKISSFQEDAAKAQELQAKVDSLSAELDKMVAIAESAQKEKARAEEKLLTLQQNWEKYVAAS